MGQESMYRTVVTILRTELRSGTISCDDRYLVSNGNDNNLPNGYVGNMTLRLLSAPCTLGERNQDHNMMLSLPTQRAGHFSALLCHISGACVMNEVMKASVGIIEATVGLTV